MSTSSQAIAAMTAFYNLAKNVASAATPPSSIVIDGTVQALFGTPTQDFAPQFIIAVTDVEATKQEPIYLGQLSRNEEFEISGTLWGSITDASDANQQACALYLAELYTSLDSAVNTDPSLGGLLIHSWLVGFKLSFDAEAQGRAVQMDYALHCEAIIN